MERITLDKLCEDIKPKAELLGISFADSTPVRYSGEDRLYVFNIKYGSASGRLCIWLSGLESTAYVSFGDPYSPPWRNCFVMLHWRLSSSMEYRINNYDALAPVKAEKYYQLGRELC